MEFEIRHTVVIGFQFIFHTEHTTAETIDKPQHFHCFRNHSVTIVVDPWEIGGIGFAIQSSRI